MKRWAPFAAAVALVATLAYAATVNITDTYIFQAVFRPWTRTTAQLPSAAAYTGYVAFNTSKAALTASDGADWRTATPMVGSRSYIFPVLGSDIPTAVVCAESFPITVTGAGFTDGCFASSNLGQDGGVALPDNVQLTCTVTAANTAKVKMCATFSDGGTYTSADAGYWARVFH